MYKTTLQELCHQRTWDLPDYDTIKQGPDHDPRFQATVTVNCISFRSDSPSKSSKQAQNEAAKLAIDHFSSSRSLPTPAPPAVASSSEGTGSKNNNLSSGATLQPKLDETNQISQGNKASTITKFDDRFTASSSEGTDSKNNNLSSGATLQPKVEETNQISQGNKASTITKFDDRFTDMEHLFKNQLQSYAQKKGLNLPVYSVECVGPSHASRFKCKVTIDGQTYESHEFFRTLSKAEHAAAKAALVSLAPNGVEEDESAYKNLLQELAQKEYSRLPTYTTSRSGEAQRPNFTSIVEVEGESFTGQGARTKKQAELSAAKAAYTALKQRKSKQGPIVSSSGNSSSSLVASCSGNSSQSPVATVSSSVGQSPVSSCVGNSSQSAPRPFAQLPSNSRAALIADLQKNVQPRMPGHNEQAEEKKEIAEVVSRDSRIPLPESNSAVKRISSPLGSSVPSSSPSHSSGSSAVVTIEPPVETNILRHNKVIIHPRGTKMTYPPGSTVLSMSDDNWVAVRTPQSSQ